MNYFLDLCNLLYTYWELFLAHLMLFVPYTVLVFALAWTVRGFAGKNKVNSELLREKNTLEDGFYRERENSRRLTEERRALQVQLEDVLRRERKKNRDLEQKNRILTEESRKLQVQSEEQRKRLSELERENSRLLQELERLKKAIKFEVEKALIEAKIAKRTGHGSVLRVEREKRQQVLHQGPEEFYRDIYQEIQQEIYQKLMEETERARRRP